MNQFSNFTSFLARHSQPWEEIQQPVQLVKISSETVLNSDGQQSTRHIATGITQEANNLLSQLPAPLYVVAFTGFGRTGKSFTASKLKEHLIQLENEQKKLEELEESVVIDLKNVNTSNSVVKINPTETVKFNSAPGNVPCTNGIDMMVFKHPTKPGHIILFDCEGGGNHNQSALPFVIGLAARLSSMLYVFERGCFTTNGFATVMQIINMGGTCGTLKKEDKIDITRSLTLCENMSINQSIPNEKLKVDLLSENFGDETTNRVRRLVKERFDVDFVKIPWCLLGNEEQEKIHSDTCKEVALKLANSVQSYTIGSVEADGATILRLASELLGQIRIGGKRYDMISATEAMVTNMATEAANTVWADFIRKVRKQQLHPTQINCRKHLRTILREIEGISNSCLNDLEAFTLKLEPQKLALVGREIFDTNLKNFKQEIKSTHLKKSQSLAKYTIWAGRINGLMTTIVGQVSSAIGQALKFARFSTGLIFMTNYYVFKRSISIIAGYSSSLLS
ncbi:hypothetical protein HDU92_005656 [Lobulomyces angularis]|nr:hypothetical protein HDU92_005656 [Lobulomyces angularis]